MKRKSFKSIRINSIYGIIFSMFFSLLGYPLILNAAKTEVVDRIVAVVNDDIITLMELNSAIKPYTEKIRTFGYSSEKEKKLMFKVRKEILDHLIDQKIEDQEIKRSKVEISPEQIDQAIEQFKDANYITDEQLRAALAKDGKTMKEYREQVKEQILRTKLVNLKVKSKIVITKEDVKAYYEKHKDQYGGKAKYHLRNILLKVPLYTDTKKKLEIKSKMDEILEKLKSGESFETLAANYSEAPTASKGGDLGEFEFDTLSPQLQKAIEKIKPGEFTPVLDTDLGYQIFYLENIINAKVKTLEEVTPEIEKKLYDETINQRYGAWLDNLRKQAVIKIIQ